MEEVSNLNVSLNASPASFSITDFSFSNLLSITFLILALYSANLFA